MSKKNFLPLYLIETLEYIDLIETLEYIEQLRSDDVQAQEIYQDDPRHDHTRHMLLGRISAYTNVENFIVSKVKQDVRKCKSRDIK